jgi:hypothetical protein
LLSLCPKSFVFASHIEKVKIKIHKTVILPVVLYGCETWSLKEECRLRVFESRRYLDLKGSKTDNEENCIMMNFITCILHLILLG